MKKVLYISGTRAEYGLIRPTLFSIKKNSALSIEIIATGMHLMPEFGRTIKDIEKDGFKIHPIKAIFQKDNKESSIKFIGEFVLKFLKKIKHIRPDIIFVQGDRPETLVGAIAGAYLGIPVAHTHGGEVSSTVDDVVRHAVTKLSHIHFAATKKSAQRIIKMGEEPWRVHIVGAPGLDSIVKEKLISRSKIVEKYKLNLEKPILLIIQHPVTQEIQDATKQMRETMEAVKELGYQTIVIYPSADPGARKIIKVIEKYGKYPFIKIYKNILHKDYLSLIGVVDAMVGNSSSGIVEAPSFKLPVVNVGTREEGRERANNVIDVDYNKHQIKKAILKAIFDKKFKQSIKKRKNPYGYGKANIKITKVLSNLKINKKLLNKKITY